MSKRKIIIWGTTGLFLFLMIMSGWYTVNQGERAVVLRFGQAVAASDPGFHLKIPFIDSVEKISVRSTKTEAKLAIYSRDIQGAEVVFSLNYAIQPDMVVDIYSHFGMEYENRIILPQIISKVKDSFGQYNAIEIVRSREKLTNQILQDMQAQLAAAGILVETTQIENIDFSDEYEKSVEERMRAEVEVTKVQQNLERERLNAEMVRVQNQAKADAQLMLAEAEAKSTRLRGEAEADAIKAKGTALAQNPALVLLVQAEKWNGQLPQTMVPGGGVPFVNVTPAIK